MKSKFGILGVLIAGLMLTSMWVKPVQIDGVVTDEQGNVLIGASIVESGTQNGIITNIDGTFSLTVSSPNATLSISYTGYETKTILLAQQDISQPLTIALSLGSVLEEIAVTGYSIEPKPTYPGKDVTFDVQVVNQGSIPANQINVSGFMKHFPRESAPQNTEDYDLITENKFYGVKDTPLSTFSIDVDAASYSNMRRFINQGQTPPKDAVRIEEMVNYFDYEYPQPEGEDPFEVVTEYSDCPWNSKHKLVHIGLQGKEIPKDNLPASNLVFLCDVSGSMSDANKLPLLQSSLKMLVNNLREQDKVSLVVYAGSSGLVLEPTPGSQKQKIKEAIDALESGGSTAGAEGIQLAYQQARKAFIEGGNNRVLLATDGDFNVGVSSDAELVRLIEKERESGVFLTVMGFGTGNYKDNKMEKLANKGNGNYAYIDNINEARKVLVNEFGGTLFTIAKDVKLQIEFNPSQVVSYRLIGYENRLLNKEDFNDDKKDAGELGAGHTVTAMYEIIPSGVKSEFVQSVDLLKYQDAKKAKKGKYGDEILTVKLRYKKPTGKKSKLISKVVSNEALDFDNTSDNYRWAATVAGFGMMLRDSEYRQEANYSNLISMGQSSLGKDTEGYRTEMIRMMKNTQAIGLSVHDDSMEVRK